MSTQEEELEAAIWQAMKTCGVSVADPVAFIELLTFAAQRYAAGDSPVLTAIRREVLHRDTWPEGQTSPSTRGGVAGSAPELHPSGSGALRQLAGDGGATLSTEASIPGPVTRHDASLSTVVESGYPQGVDR